MELEKKALENLQDHEYEKAESQFEVEQFQVNLNDLDMVLTRKYAHEMTNPYPEKQ